MDLKKIRKLRDEIQRMRRRGGLRPAELENLARSVGRVRHKRGKEPSWVSTVFLGAPPVSIPNHPGDLSKYTARSILNELEADLDRFDSVAEEDQDE